MVIRPSDVELALKEAIVEKVPQRTDTQRFIIDRYDRLFFVVVSYRLRSDRAWSEKTTSSFH